MNLPGELEAHHHHSGNPKEYDVKAITNKDVGKYLSTPSVLLGQPKEPKDHREDENQVSKTSST